MPVRWLRWPGTMQHAEGRPPLAYGGDYNPEQWPRETWVEDVALMREAGVNIVNLGIFAWAQVQPAAGEWDFQWLDEVMDLLHDSGVAVDLGTGTSSPPPWLTEAHPEILPVTADGRTLSPGGRQHWRGRRDAGQRISRVRERFATAFARRARPHAARCAGR